MPKKVIWTEAKREKVIIALKFGATNAELAVEFKTTPKAIERMLNNYGYGKYRKEKKVIVRDEILIKEVKRKRITKPEADQLIKYLGARLYNDFKVEKLAEPKCRTVNKGKPEEFSVLDISDTHIGMINKTYDNESCKTITTYNNEIFCQELNNLKQGVMGIHKILSNSYQLKKLYINILGDIITNDRIFPEQVFEIEECVGRQMWRAIPAFAQFFKDLLKVYSEIEVNCVVGNHGRSQFQYEEPVENNFEYFIYKTWEKQFQESKRIKINVPDSRRAIAKIGPWRHLLEHGDLIKGQSENALEKQINDLYREMGGFDCLHLGHFHQLREREISDKVIVKQNGCWIYRDNWAFKHFKKYSVPRQHFFGCNKNRVETWAFKLDIRS